MNFLVSLCCDRGRILAKLLTVRCTVKIDNQSFVFFFLLFSPSGPFHDGGLKRRESKFKIETSPVNTRVLFRSILFYF